MKDINIKELEKAWDLSRTGLKARAKALGIELLRPSPKATFWPSEYVEAGHDLDRWIKSGKPLKEHPSVSAEPKASAELKASEALDERLSHLEERLAFLERRITLIDANQDRFQPTGVASKLLGISAHTLKRWGDPQHSTHCLIEGKHFHRGPHANSTVRWDVEAVRAVIKERSLQNRPDRFGYNQTL